MKLYIKSNNEYEFDYSLLSRLVSDCKYFLGGGNRSEKYLWAGNVADQIAKMRELYAKLPEKPEWLSEEDIDDYEEKMLNNRTVTSSKAIVSNVNSVIHFTKTDLNKLGNAVISRLQDSYGYLDLSFEEAWIELDDELIIMQISIYDGEQIFEEDAELSDVSDVEELLEKYTMAFALTFRNDIEDYLDEIGYEED